MFSQQLDLAGLLEEAGTQKPPDIGHIHLMTADAERTLTFWRDVVGLAERQRFGTQAVFLAEGLYHHHMGANTWHSAGAGPAPDSSTGLESFELRLREQAAVDAAAEGLERNGIALSRDGERVEFRDPDSTRVILSVR